MTRGLPAALASAFQAGTLAAIHLVELDTGRAAPNDVLRFTDWDEDLVFPTSGGSTYLSRFSDTGAAFDLGEVWTEGAGEEGSLDLRIPDPDSLIRGHIDAGAWATRQACRLYRVEYDQRDSAAKALKNTYVVEGYENPDYEVVFRLSSLTAVFARIRIPKGIITRDEWKGMPRQ